MKDQRVLHSLRRDCQRVGEQKLNLHKIILILCHIPREVHVTQTIWLRLVPVLIRPDVQVYNSAVYVCQVQRFCLHWCIELNSQFSTRGDLYYLC